MAACRSPSDENQFDKKFECLCIQLISSAVWRNFAPLLHQRSAKAQRCLFELNKKAWNDLGPIGLVAKAYAISSF